MATLTAWAAGVLTKDAAGCWVSTTCQAAYWGIPTPDRNTQWGHSHRPGPTPSKWPEPGSEAALLTPRALFVSVMQLSVWQTSMHVRACNLDLNHTWVQPLQVLTCTVRAIRASGSQHKECSGLWAKIRSLEGVGQFLPWARPGVPSGPLCMPRPPHSPQRAAWCYSEGHCWRVTLCARLMRLWTHTEDFTMFLFTNTNRRALCCAQSSVPRCHDVRGTLGVDWCSKKTLGQISGCWTVSWQLPPYSLQDFGQTLPLCNLQFPHPENDGLYQVTLFFNYYLLITCSFQKNVKWI